MYLLKVGWLMVYYVNVKSRYVHSIPHKKLWGTLWTAMPQDLNKSFTHIEHRAGASLLLAMRARNASDTRVTGCEAQETMGSRKSRPFSPSRLPLRANFHRETHVWVRGSCRCGSGRGDLVLQMLYTVNRLKGRFPFVRTERPDHSSHFKNFFF